MNKKICQPPFRLFTADRFCGFSESALVNCYQGAFRKTFLYALYEKPIEPGTTLIM